MKPRSIFIVIIAIIALLLFFSLRRAHQPAGDTTTNAAAFHPAGTAPASGASQSNQTFHRVPIPSQPLDPNDGKIFDIKRLSEPGYSARMQKTMAIRDYYESPIRDTPEVKRIVELLAKEGVGLEAVRDVHYAVWDHQSKLDMITQAPPGAKADVTKMVDHLWDEKVAALRDKFGVTNPAFYEELKNMKLPTFFGQGNMTPPFGQVLAE